MTLYIDMIKAGLDPAEFGITPDTPYDYGPSGPPPAETPPGGTPPPDPAPGLPGTAAQRDAQATIKSNLTGWGFSDADIEALAQFTWGELVGGTSATQVGLDLYKTPQFKTRFPAMADRQAKGLPPISPAEYVQLEKGYAQIFSRTNMPKGFYDNNEDYRRLIANDWSVDEVTDVVKNVYNAVEEAPPEVRDYFASSYGIYGDAALASIIMDGDRALPTLENMARTAQIGGQSTIAGFGLGRFSAERLAQLGVSDFELRSAFDKTRAEQGLLAETYGENRNLTDEDAINAALNASPGTADLLRQRQSERVAAFTPTGGSVLTRQGFAGLGGAEQT